MTDASTPNSIAIDLADGGKEVRVAAAVGNAPTLLRYISSVVLLGRAIVACLPAPDHTLTYVVAHAPGARTHSCRSLASHSSPITKFFSARFFCAAMAVPFAFTSSSPGWTRPASTDVGATRSKITRPFSNRRSTPARSPAFLVTSTIRSLLCGVEGKICVGALAGADGYMAELVVVAEVLGGDGAKVAGLSVICALENGS